eukprot:GDKJ01026694.1.p1 GENE.GDKJ01026694.1~~GDKJ01026694.1.p1  ORF type:complete len:115 (-),score=22.44 GDKJ01026694.1:137-481(-)
MEDQYQHEFISEEIEIIIRSAVNSTIGAPGITYNKDKVDTWCSQIVDHCLKKLSDKQRSFKYVVICTIMQKTNAALYTATGGFWDVKTDGMTSQYLEDAEKTMDCVVSVYGLAI